MSIEQSLTGFGDNCVITRDFTRYDQGYQDKALKYIDNLGALSIALRKFSEYSRTMLASQQLYIHATWLARYPAYWPELDRMVDRLENSFDDADQCYVARQSSIDGSWGWQYNEFHHKFDATIVRLHELVREGRAPRYPLSFLEPIATAPAMRDHLEKLLVSDIATTGRNQRDEFGSVICCLAQLCFKPSLRRYAQENVLGIELDQSYVDAFTGVLYTPNSRVSLNAAASYDVRPPSLYELFGDEGASVGNDELREETAINAELGAAFETKSSRVFVSGFYRALDDAIVLIYDARGIGQAENITKARIYGITFDASSQLNSWLGLHADITVQSSEDLSEVRAFQGNSLPGVYENKLRLCSTARLNGYEMSLEYRLQSDGYYDRTAAAEMPTSQQFDIDVKKNWASHTLALSLINLNDERVEDFNRFPGPGRRAFITYNYIF